MEILVTFDNTHAAIALEKAVQEQGIKARLIGTPERVSASCGLSLKAKATDLGAIQALITSNHIDPEVTLYQIVDRQEYISYQKLE